MLDWRVRRRTRCSPPDRQAWCRNDDFDYTRTPSGERRIPHRELRRLAGDTRPTDRVALYARVSSHSQSENGDLDRQLARLTEYAHDHGWSVENTYTDIGSDLDEDHRGLNPFSMTYRKPTTDAFSSLIKIDSLVGFSYLKRHFDYYAITVTIIEDGTDKSAREELVDDLIKLVASFSGKLYGMCSSKKQQVVNTVESEVKPDE